MTPEPASPIVASAPAMAAAPAPPESAVAEPLPVENRAWVALRIAALFLVALALRAWILLQPRLGHDQDLELFARWIRKLADHGLSGFYHVEHFCDYPPLMLLLFQATGAIADLLTAGPADESALRIGVKVLAAVADVAIGVLLLIEARRLLGLPAAVVAAALYLLNPVAIYDGVVWGQLDAVYTALLLAGLLFVGRRRWMLAGIAAALSLAAKFQSIAIVPLLLFEAYRIGGWRGVGRFAAGGVIAAAAVAAPFAGAGTLREAVTRGYVNVVGQYHEKSKNAYNLWWLLGDPGQADSSPPPAVLNAVADGRTAIPADESWLLKATWRNISLALFALSVAVVLSLYARRPGPMARFGAAGLLAFCFFLFPTEMHERYAFPAVGLLAIWAAARPSHERLYWAFTLLMLLNLAAVLPPGPLGAQIAAANLLVFVLLLTRLNYAQKPATEGPGCVAEEPVRSRRRLIPAFQLATVLLLLVFVAAGAWVFQKSRSVSAAPDQPGTVWLSSLTPRTQSQGWGELGRDRAVSGGSLRVGDTIFLKGLGTHAPARLVYAIPSGAQTFEATLGIDYAARQLGSAILRVELDGQTVFTSPEMRGDASATAVSLPVAGAKILTLVVDPGRDGRKSDHFDLGLARFVTTPTELRP